MEQVWLTLSLLEGTFAICRLEPDAEQPAWAITDPFYSITRTPEELSVICLEAAVPPDVRAERGWRCFKAEGPLDFSLTGVLASLTAPLARASVTIFVVSTFDTDYLLVRERDLEKAVLALTEAGHRITQ